MDKWNVIPFPGLRTGKGGKAIRKEAGTRIKSWAGSLKAVQFIAEKKWMILLTVMGFLLGKAMILDELSPFAIAYFAVIMFLRRDFLLPVGIAILAGGFFAPYPTLFTIAAEVSIFYLLYRGLSSFGKTELSYAPVMVFTSAFMVNLFTVLIGPSFTWYAVLMMTIDAVLSFVLTLVFIQAIPVFTYRKKNVNLRSEEILCLIILLASVMTGAVGFTVYNLSAENVLSRYLILVFALVGGAPLGASVGVITGLILSLANMSAIYQMSLLAFSGMLAGMLKEGKKMAVSLGMLLGSSILAIYLGGTGDVITSTYESCAAILLFLLTPKSILNVISKYVPGTQDHSHNQHEYAKRIRDLTAERVTRFSQVFKQLSKSFDQMSEAPEIKQGQQDMEHFMNAVADGTCAACFKQSQCWDGKFYQTYKYMTEMMSAIEENPDFEAKDIPASWTKSCAKTEAVLDVMKRQYGLYQDNMQWKRQIYDSRVLVAEQLSGVSQVMEDLAREIQRETTIMHKQEDQIRSALEQLGLSIHSIDIINLDAGHVEIEIVHAYTKGFDECRKIIAPLLSDILDEHIAVVEEVMTLPKQGLATVTFGSAKTYEVTTGVAGAAKGGGLLSGDSYSTVELGNGTFAVALSDGMGNGERARMESSTALNILEQLLQSGMDAKLAIKSVNSILMLRSPEEIYATVDMALIDQYSAQSTFLKIGSTPSFIKRGDEVIPVSASNLPIGIIKDIEVDLVSIQLNPGDIVIMMTDGIYDAPGYAVNKEMWMKRMIQELDSEDPQEIADILLERVIRYQQNKIHDDMTVVVGKVDHFRPEWATLRIPGMDRMERPRTVS
ncbi:stage II sporulation protein E [Paenibacillus sp. TCA20]|uniref:Stage II sporulation protein E n=1 Tax=Paenibacillus urinalis TaxID=521520 RepID=A0AAX3N0Z7_9BACL|nr:MULTISPECIES: stage II sporulation protein E [Paenibacillus]WDH82759.1 stage II sporulation protein E [Paenibacillus urinalis]WDI02503.1 stage II sporulation protein E [Paenibacillus urinalis]GAK43123.1 stage II sporulation protein E [Paenibacillus sp. TCA20]